MRRHREIYLAKSLLRLCKVDADCARVMSSDPDEGKGTRPFVGIVIPHAGRRYCIPLSSPKPKHARMRADRDFSKIVDESGRLIGALNFNNMVPASGSVLHGVDLNPRRGRHKGRQGVQGAHA